MPRPPTPEEADELFREKFQKVQSPIKAPLDDGTLQEISRLVFQDDRWPTAQRQLAMKDLGREQALKMLQEGARLYGFWPNLAQETLEALVSQVMEEETTSRGLQQWMESNPIKSDLGCIVPKPQKDTKSASSQSFKSGRSGFSGPKMEATDTFATSRWSAEETTGVEVLRFIPAEKLPKAATILIQPTSGLPDWKGHMVSPNYFRVINASIHIIVFLGCAAYAMDLVTNKYPQASLMFSWPIFFARLGGMACAVWTALLFLSMSRSILTIASRFLPRRGRSFWFTFLDCHKDLHIEAGKALVFYSGVHIVGHCIGTVPGMLQKDVAELNEMLGCAQEDPPYIAEWDLSIFHWPQCPMTEADKPMTFTEALFMTMPGLTGFFLVLVLVAIAITSRHKFRAQSFEFFWKLHNVAIFLWPILLFLHGSQGWIGIGIPLVIVVSGLPIVLYALTRVARMLRWC